MGNIDLSIKFKDLTFRNPIIPGASDIIMDEMGVIKCIEQGVGGIVTKSFTSGPWRTKAQPYHFNYRIFGKGLENNWISRGGFHPFKSEMAAEKLIPAMARLCKNEGIPLIISIANGANVEEWVMDAKRFEQAGADMLELNFSCPVAGQDESFGKALGQNVSLTKEIIMSIKNSVKIPISPKLSISWDPFAPHIRGFVEAGADCLTTQNTPIGMLIDVEEEVPFGIFGVGGYQMGRSLLPMSISRVVETRGLTNLPLIASGGVWTSTDAIMYLLIGCSLVEVVGAIFKNGIKHFGEIIKGIEEWMKRKGYNSIEDFKGKVYGLARKAVSPELIHMELPFPMPREKSSSIIPQVDMEQCLLCGRCENFCLNGVFIVDKTNNIVNVNHENRCWGCGDCIGWCPADAIKLINKETNEVVWDNHGLARPYRPENWKD